MIANGAMYEGEEALAGIINSGLGGTISGEYRQGLCTSLRQGIIYMALEASPCAAVMWNNAKYCNSARASNHLLSSIPPGCALGHYG